MKKSKNKDWKKWACKIFEKVCCWEWYGIVMLGWFSIDRNLAPHFSVMGSFCYFIVVQKSILFSVNPFSRAMNKMSPLKRRTIYSLIWDYPRGMSSHKIGLWGIKKCRTERTRNAAIQMHITSTFLENDIQELRYVYYSLFKIAQN